VGELKITCGDAAHDKLRLHKEPRIHTHCDTYAHAHVYAHTLTRCRQEALADELEITCGDVAHDKALLLKELRLTLTENAELAAKCCALQRQLAGAPSGASSDTLMTVSASTPLFLPVDLLKRLLAAQVTMQKEYRADF